MVRATDENAERAQRANDEALAASNKNRTASDKAQAKADAKLAATDSPAQARMEQGDWAKTNNPSPKEQADESARTAAISREANR